MNGSTMSFKSSYPFFLFSVESDLHTLDSMVVAYASGHLIWITPLRLRTTCRVDLRNFPFDEQTCSMYFASWVYNGHQVNLTLWGGQESTAFTLESETVRPFIHTR